MLVPDEQLENQHLQTAEPPGQHYLQQFFHKKKEHNNFKE